LTRLNANVVCTLCLLSADTWLPPAELLRFGIAVDFFC